MKIYVKTKMIRRTVVQRFTHPSKTSLLEFAERYVAAQPGTPAEIGEHVATCRRCRDQVSGMARTFDVLSEANPLEPPRHLTARILFAARYERRMAIARLVRYRRLVRVSKAMSVAAAAVVVVQVVYVPYANAPSRQAQPVAPKAIERPMQAAGNSLARPVSQWDDRRAGSSAERLLREAVVSPSAPVRTIHRDRATRAMESLDADTSAALAELERNPALKRANQVVMNNRRQIAEELTAWFVERPL